ncbi:competence protein CoiA [Lysobacter sp. CA196]|uniref:competence protein CoiA n=1 Tax=Lysobacter sp. CA196 TaxID=3455606 RepID=UPI003F8D44B4
MLTAICQPGQTKVEARNVSKADGPFICPTCRKDVIVSKGLIRIHHFRHKPPVTCYRGRGESQQHLAAKQAIYDALLVQAGVADLELEKDFGVSVADVYARISGVPVAIEIQKSNLSVADITARTLNYHRLGIAVLWLGLWNPELGSLKYRPKAWERWCHAAYFGRVFYWAGGETIRPVQFAPFSTYVEERTWYESGGYEQSAGGYSKRSKAFRTPRRGTDHRISGDFVRRLNDGFRGGSVSVPRCTLYASNKKN